MFAEGALSAKTKQIIAVAVAHVTQCPYCIKGHTKAARGAGATPQELMEAIWVASRNACRRRLCPRRAYAGHAEFGARLTPDLARLPRHLRSRSTARR